MYICSLLRFLFHSYSLTFSFLILKCSEDCGTGKVTRSVYCATPSGQVKPDIYCRGKTKPSHERQCRLESGCRGKWFTGPWSQVNSMIVK